MNLFRKSAWAFVMLMLGAAAGCTGEDQTTNPSNPAPNAPAKPVVPPSTQTAGPKEGDTKDMPPPKSGDVKKPDESPKLEPPKAEGKGDTAAAKLTPDEIAAIKQLPAAEQEQAIKQAVCPVSGHHLGSEEMGKPIKITAEGRTFFLCCEGCEPEVKKDPKAVIAKLDAKAAK